MKAFLVLVYNFGWDEDSRSWVRQMVLFREEAYGDVALCGFGSRAFRPPAFRSKGLLIPIRDLLLTWR